jgi:hypothetical protein
MSSISSLKLESAIGGQTTYTSPITDLLRYNSLSYSAFYIHASLLICNLKVYFSNTTADEDFKLYSTITLDNEVRATGNLLIPSRYVKFTMENPAPDAMEDVDVVLTAHKTATSNIDVNIGSDDITISGVATETTQLAVKGVLDDISLNTLSLYNLDKRTFNLPRTGLVLHNSVAISADTTSTQFIIGQNDDDLTSKDIYNTIQLNGRVPFDSSYSCVLEFSNDGVNYFSDHIEPDIKRLGTSAYKTFSLTRTNVCSTYARVYHLQSATELFLQASLMRY